MEVNASKFPQYAEKNQGQDLKIHTPFANALTLSYESDIRPDIIHLIVSFTKYSKPQHILEKTCYTWKLGY